MLGGNNMAPPELCQALKAQTPVLRVPLDVEQHAAIHCPHKEVAPVSVKDIHQALYLWAVQLRVQQDRDGQQACEVKAQL